MTKRTKHPIARNATRLTGRWIGGMAALAILLLPALPLHASDWEGTWLVRAEKELSHCPNLGRTYGKVFTYTITVKNGQITAFEKDRSRTFTGVVNPKDPTRAHLRGVVAMEGGYTNEIIDIELVDPDHLRGGTVWHWSDGVYQCGGSLTFVGHREGAPETPAAGAKSPTAPASASPEGSPPPAPEPASEATPASPG